MSDTTPPAPTNRNWLSAGRILILGVAGVIVVLGLVLVAIAVGESENEEPARVDALASSDNECVECHRRTTPGIVQQYGMSSMAAAEVECEDCHEVDSDYPGAVEHEGTYVLRSPTSAKCETCHQAEVAQYNQSRHSIPAYVAMVGLDGLTEDQLAMYHSIPEAQPAPNEMRNALFAIEGPAVTRFACESCHGIGAPAEDGSVGQCQKCHLRHEFSLEQARKPETCNACHIGPDHPQWEIYQESPHGIAYMTSGDEWNWDAEPGTLTVEDFPAATCAVCHMSGFGAAGTTHDVGDRLTWYLFSPVSERRPSWEDNKVRMQNVCSECHNQNYIDDFYTDGDALVESINQWVNESTAMLQPLKDNDLLTSTPFDEEIDFVYFELWHHWGRTAKFGAWMQGPDYTQWHGAYEMLSDLEELQAMVNEKLIAGGVITDDEIGPESRVVNDGTADAGLPGGAPESAPSVEATGEAPQDTNGAPQGMPAEPSGAATAEATEAGD
ncbi:MAG TPA: multiheme c-type cytochrome [Aggregatilinea sp.]|uniref:multiheme c-type cytochrome n=1 Tax=Aggregatilinea sp. TaxID=2806333 RepID=UPI002D072C0B|nr:multiheme c-type cytochrome [Aggregatilinea sp.]HML20257.1 multiheme c-type cytochrome [Aggregatilinea sp.]